MIYVPVPLKLDPHDRAEPVDIPTPAFFVPVPLNQVQLGRPMPVDICTPQGLPLLGRGQTLRSEAQRDKLAYQQASMSEIDAKAWQKALERSLRQMHTKGFALEAITRAPMPGEIMDTDFLTVLQESLRTVLYQGAQAVAPMPRIEAIEAKALFLIKKDPDECLFVLFQTLPDRSLGYCATNALLCGVVGVLAAEKLALPQLQSAMLMRAALVMNISMAQQQDSLAGQRESLSPQQRSIITAHPSQSADILRSFGVQDPELLGIVHWHHEPEAAIGLIEQLTVLRLLNQADTLVAKMAPRVSRRAMSTLGAVKSLVLDVNEQNHDLRWAMASAMGFYPPGTYVQLANGERAVAIARGKQASTPHVASLINANGMPMNTYLYRDTSQDDFAVRAALPAGQVNIRVNVEKVRQLRLQRGV